MLLVIDLVEVQKSSMSAKEDIAAEIELIIELHSATEVQVFLSSLKNLWPDEQFDCGVQFSTPQLKSDRVDFYKFVAASMGFEQLLLVTADGTGSSNPEIFRAHDASILSWLYKSNASVLDTVKQRNKPTNRFLYSSTSSAISRSLVSQIHSVLYLVEDIYVVSNILTKNELDSFSSSDCGVLCSMGYLKSALRWLDSRNRAYPETLSSNYASCLKESIINVLNSRYEGDPINNEDKVSKSYFSLAALAFNLSRYYLAVRGSSTAFILIIRALDFYLISILLSTGDLEVRQEYSGIKSIFLNSKRVSGVGALWTACVNRFHVTDRQINIIRGYIEVRNSSILAHGLNLISESYVELTIEYINTVIEVLESQMFRPSNRWGQVITRTGCFLDYRLGKLVTFIFDQSNNIKSI